MSEISDQLRRLYEVDDVAKRVIDHMAQRSKGNKLEVDVLQKRISLSRSELVFAFRQLEAIGVGRFIVGRRGSTSRFETNRPPAEIAGVAKGERAELGGAQEEEETFPDSSESSASSGAETALRHVWVLRPSPLVKIEIPYDITSAEAERLIAFVKSLPVE